MRELTTNDDICDSDIVLPIVAADILHPDAVYRILRMIRKNKDSDSVFFDFNWANGAHRRESCFCPDYDAMLCRENKTVLYGSIAFRGDVWKGSCGSFDKALSMVETPCHVRECLVNKLIPRGQKLPCIPWVSDEGPEVSIVIPTKNRLDCLQACVESIRRNTSYRRYSILLVDNGTDDAETAAYLDRCGCAVFRHNKPFNYSELINVGVRHTESPLVLLLNNDVEIHATSRNWLSVLVEEALRPSVGVVGALLEYPCGAIQHGGVGVFRERTGIRMSNLFGGSWGCPFWAQIPRECDAVTGACQLIRRETFDAVDGYDEQMPVVCNDVDFCLRARYAGWRIRYTPFARLVHHEGVSSAISKDQRALYARSHAIFDERHQMYVCEKFVRAEWH